MEMVIQLLHRKTNKTHHKVSNSFTIRIGYIITYVDCCMYNYPGTTICNFFIFYLIQMGIMVKEDKGSEVIEHGDIFFFYRPKVGTEEVEGIKDVQRFYMVTAPEENGHSNKNNIYRLFLIGQKQLPEIVEGKSTSKERNWALNTLTTSNAEDIHKELLPAEYITETRGKRRIAAAVPAGEGKYSIVKHDGHTELAYILELPEVPGPTQREFEIRKEASYIISVKNPKVKVGTYQSRLTKGYY
jgi:hypothetical protein